MELKIIEVLKLCPKIELLKTIKFLLIIEDLKILILELIYVVLILDKYKLLLLFLNCNPLYILKLCNLELNLIVLVLLLPIIKSLYKYNLPKISNFLLIIVLPKIVIFFFV